MNEQERKRVLIQKNIASVMNVKKDLEKITATLTNDFESLMEKAKKLGEETLLILLNRMA